MQHVWTYRQDQPTQPGTFLPVRRVETPRATTRCGRCTPRGAVGSVGSRLAGEPLERVCDSCDWEARKRTGPRRPRFPVEAEPPCRASIPRTAAAGGPARSAAAPGRATSESGSGGARTQHAMDVLGAEVASSATYRTGLSERWMSRWSTTMCH
jgi:hypothetical protein